MDDDEQRRKDLLAVALKYEREIDAAPRVVAKGKNYIADQIITIAKEQGVEIREDADLVEILAVLELDSYIPIEAYVAVAEILSYVYRANADK